MHLQIQKKTIRKKLGGRGQEKRRWRRRRRGRDAVKVEEGQREDEEGLDAVKRLAVVCIAVALRRTALLAGRSCSHVRTRERLQLVQLLRQFAQHTGAEVGAALGKRPVHAVGEGTHKTHAENRLIGLGKHAGNTFIHPSFFFLPVHTPFVSHAFSFSCHCRFEKKKQSK